MKILKSQLKRIIKEEISKVLRENASATSYFVVVDDDRPGEPHFYAIDADGDYVQLKDPEGYPGLTPADIIQAIEGIGIDRDSLDALINTDHLQNFRAKSVSGYNYPGPQEIIDFKIFPPQRTSDGRLDWSELTPIELDWSELLKSYLSNIKKIPNPQVKPIPDDFAERYEDGTLAPAAEAASDDNGDWY